MDRLLVLTLFSDFTSTGTISLFICKTNSTSAALAKREAISSGEKPAMPQPMRVTRNCWSGWHNSAPACHRHELLLGFWYLLFLFCNDSQLSGSLFHGVLRYTALKATRHPTIIAYILSPCAIAEVSIHCNQAHRAHRTTEAAIVVFLRIDFTAFEVQAICVIVRVGCAWPVVAERADIVERSPIDEASKRQEESLTII